ncbi:hypothetical protein JTB14_010984 [Gonioctena quinquepunctata]|nr:hypothetical protein JTB14_010984 [Gonioctena quinquepunctata]
MLSDNLREKLLAVKDLTLPKCIDICRADEESRKQVKVISAGTSTEYKIDMMKFGNRSRYGEMSRKQKEIHGRNNIIRMKLRACVDLNLIKRIDVIGQSHDDIASDISSSEKIINEYSDVFKDLGCFGKPCTIRIQSDAIPHVARCRKIPLALNNVVKEALDNMNHVNDLIEGLEGTLAYIDDILIYGATLEEHNKRLECFLEKAKKDLAFKKLKKLITEAPILSYFNPNLPVVLATDASQYGLGGHISQNGHPIAFWSMSLNSAQLNYAQIEKVLLAIVLGCEKFHYYLYGRPFIAITDHKPLLGIVKKPIDSLSPRLQKLVIKLLKYDVTLQFLPGKELHIPDLLSRNPLKDKKDTCEVDDFHIRSIITVSDEKRKELLEKIKNDEELQMVLHYINNG